MTTWLAIGGAVVLVIGGYLYLRWWMSPQPPDLGEVRGRPPRPGPPPPDPPA